MFFSHDNPPIEVSELKDKVKTKGFISKILDGQYLETNNPLAVKLYNNGVKPEYPTADNNDHASILNDWFIDRMTSDIHYLITASEEQYERFLDQVDLKSTRALFELGSIAAKYDLYPADYNENGIKKITDAAEREQFEKYFLNEAVLNSAFEILAYVYFKIFGSLYVVKT